MNPLSERLASLTPEQRAKLLRKLKTSQQNRSQSRIPSRTTSDNRFPLSFTQQRIWFLNQLESENPFYNIPSLFHLTGPLDVAALEKSLNAMAKRHECLRTAFQLNEQGQPIQVIAPEITIPLPIADFQHLGASERNAQSQQAAIEEFQQPFALSEPPLWRARLLQRQPQDALLALTMHHTIFDGWALGIFVKELATLYEAYVQGKPASLPELEIQYADYAVWQRHYFQGEIRDQQLAYWKSQLSGQLPVLELPSDRVRPKHQTFEGALYSQLLPYSLYKDLKTLSRENQATLFMTTLAAFYVLLYRYSGETDLIVGFPITGRHFQEIENLIGPCVNTLALRANLSADLTFRELLSQVREITLDAYTHQDLPFDALVEAIQPERNLSHNPLFQVMFTLQNALPDIQADELNFDYQGVDMGISKFDLSLDIFEGPEGPTCVFEYNSDLFDRDRIERMGNHYQALLADLIAHPDRGLSQLQLLSAREQQQMLQDWNQTETEFLPDSFLTLFEGQAAKTPDAVAVSWGTQRLSYRTLNQQANCLARALQAEGVTTDTVVPLLAERSPFFLIGILGIFKAGGAYLPLDLHHPVQRSRHALSQSQAQLVLTTQDLRETIQDILASLETSQTPHFYYLEDLLARNEPDSNLATVTSPHQLAYVIFTSGSTGVPKGVAIEQAGMLNHLHVMNHTLDLSATDVVAQTASQCFDISVWQYLSALMVGGCVHIIPNNEVREPIALLKQIQAARISILEIVPSLLQTVVTELTTNEWDLSCLRWLIPTGEALPPELCRRWLNLYPHIPLLNAYGPAECADDVTLYPITAPPSQEMLQMPIGRPVANLQVYVLDQHQQPLPPGICGELYIGGIGVGRGYLNDPDRSAEAFLENPFDHRISRRLYRTGDLGQYLPDGTLVFLGRADDQVKIRGFRIELGEIEAVLLQHPHVEATAVRVWEDGLAGYIVSTVSQINRAEVLDFVAQSLPDYMVPSTLTLLEALPLNANGKVNREALPKPESSSLDLLDQHYIGPRTATEEVLAEIWAQAFDLGRVSIHDDFFSLGGHSLLAIQIASQVRQSFQVELPLHHFFATPTVAGLAAVIAEQQGQQAAYEDFINALPQVEPDRANWHEPFPLTEVQEAYWIGRDADFELGNVSTHNYDELVFENLNLERFDWAWQTLIQRHGMLRAIVHPHGQQQILETVPRYEIPIVDFRGLSEADVETQITALRDEMNHQVLDTSQWPVFDLRISLHDNGVARLHVSTDSLTFDAWSFVVLMKELVTLHENPETVLPDLDFSFRDYVLAEQSLRNCDHYQRSLQYWQEVIPTLPPAPELPLVKNPGAVTRPHFTRLHNSLDIDTWKRLKSKATRCGMTATGILLAAYAETLTAWSKSPTFTLNLTFLNRLPFHPQVNELVGEFTSLTLLGIDNSDDHSFASRAKRIQQRLWRDLENHYVSGIHVLRELKRIQGGVKTAKMPVVFTSALTLPIPKKEDTPLSLRPIHSITQTSQVMLDCGVWEDSGVMYCNWDVVEELFPPDMLQEMFAQYFQLLHRLANDEAIWQQSHMELVPESQLALQASMNATAAPTSEALLHTLFCDQVGQQPEAPAVVSGAHTFTYEELDRLSNRIGNRLRELGAQPNTLVAVVMEKGWEQVAAVLGILKAGAAYLPIDPEVPEQRLHYLLDRSDANFVLTQSWLTTVLEWPDRVQYFAVDTETFATDSVLAPEPCQTIEDLAYVIFTSGSTGTPKGVKIDHRGAVNTIVDINQRFNVTERDRVLAISALNFDLSVYDIFGVLGAGGTIVMPNAADRKDPRHWLELVENHQITLWNSVPALMQMQVEEAESLGKSLPESLRLVMLSGDWIPLALPDQIRRASTHGDLQIISLGGATEASIWSILYPIETVPPEWSSIPYGRPMANQTFYVLNAALEPCPLWVTGELYIGGIGLAKGYWKDEDKTGSRFIVHPRTGEKLYRTGDLGRFLPDGNIEFLGREDFQVKVQGYRIELGEIETALCKHPHVRQAVVTAVGEQAGNKKLVAYVVPEAEDNLDTRELQSFLQQHLLEYMLPAAFVPLDALPLTANGKIDRQSLPEVDVSRAETTTAFTAPRTPTESAIATIWAELLQMTNVGIDDDFFTLGGDSMSVVQMNARLREELQQELPLRQVFETPSIRELSQYLQPAR